MPITSKVKSHTGSETGLTLLADLTSDLASIEAEVNALALTSGVSGIATGGSATTLIDSGLTLGINAFVNGLIVVNRAGAFIRAETIISNTATTVSFATGAPVLPGDSYTLFSQASGITPDANGEIAENPAGAAAQLALGRIGARKRADGSWDGLCIALPAGFDLHAWTDELVSGQIYSIATPTNGPVTSGTVFVEVLRLTSDSSSLKRRSLRCTAWPSGETYTASNNGATWTPWAKLATDKPLVWTTPTFVNGWVADTSISAPRYAIDDIGNVIMEGRVLGGSNITDTIIFTIAGYSSARYHHYAAPVYGGVGDIYITPAGAVHFYGINAHTGDASAWLSISTIVRI